MGMWRDKLGCDVLARLGCKKTNRHTATSQLQCKKCQSAQSALTARPVLSPNRFFFPNSGVRLHSRSRPCYRLRGDDRAFAGKERRMRSLSLTAAAVLVAASPILAQAPGTTTAKG